ncbi:M12 family metallo-peptidase [Nocardioides yefusunii]|uniref:M12 family metallo-peptidase n=1 Tax=Nocardioides yefusunii TaxID=2500546 RepID=A0ABW1QUH4_9ACTN|nr:M12 family metallo-peptidase [Nocardioides yefusunii]
MAALALISAVLPTLIKDMPPGIPEVHSADHDGSAATTTSATTDASAEATTAPVHVELDLDLDSPASGRAAVRILGGRDGSDLAAVARAHAMSATELADLFVRDVSLHVDASGQLLFADALDEQVPVTGSGIPETAGGVDFGGWSDPMLPPSVDATFALHSRPGAKRTIFLDFDGFEFTDTQQWKARGFYRGWDPSKDGAAFNDEERLMVQDVWRRVAANFAIFDVDVTTEQPSAAALERSNVSDPEFGAVAVISDNANIITHIQTGGSGSDPDTDEVANGVVGLAYLNTFGSMAAYGPSWAASRTPSVTWANSRDAAWTAHAVSHEVGHNLNLTHTFARSGDDASDVSDLHARIMDYAGARPLEVYPREDRSTISAAGAQLLPDEAGNSASRAAQLPATGRVSGVVSNSSNSSEDGRDEDWYRLEECSWLSARVTVTDRLSALDLKLTLRDAEGAEVATDAPATQLTTGILSGRDASLEGLTPQGPLYLVVSGSSPTAGGVEPADPRSVLGTYPSSHANGRYALAVAGCRGLPSGALPPSGFSGITTPTGTTTLTWDPLPDTPLDASRASVEIKVADRRAVTVPVTETSWSTTTSPGVPVEVKVRLRTPAGASAWAETVTSTGPKAPLHLSVMTTGGTTRVRIVRHPADSSTTVNIFIPSMPNSYFPVSPVPTTWVYPTTYASAVGQSGRMTFVDPRFPGKSVNVPFTVRAEAAAPSPPTQFTAYRRGDSIDLSWAPPRDDGGAPLRYVAIVGHSVTEVDGTQFSTSVQGVSRTTDTAAQIIALNRAGASHSDVIALPAVNASNSRPSAPTEVQLDTEGDSTALIWGLPRDEGSSPVTGWVVTIGDRTVEYSRSTRSMVLTGFRTDRSMAVTLAALNREGVGPARTVTLSPSP